MATKISTIYTLITADDKPLKRGLASARTASVSGAKKIQNALNKINFKAIAIGATAMAATMGYAASKFIKLAIEQEAVEKRLGAVIKSTGQAAGYNLDQLKKMASAMQNVTTTGDETILSGMAILATFKQIRGEAFERTTMSALNLAEVVGTDLNAAMIQLGKALNDPVANLGALSRAGIQFTKSQKLVIKELWTSGQTAKAQSIILDELESQFGGTAKAARDQFGGALKSLKNTLGDIGETIGFALIPPLGDVVKGFSDWIKENDKLLLQDVPNYTRQVGEGLLTVVKSFSKLAAVYDKFPSGTAVAAAGGIIGWRLFGSLGPAGIVTALVVIAQQLTRNAEVTKKAIELSPFGQIAEAYKDTTEQVNKLLRQLGILDEYSMKVGTGMRNALSWKQKGDSGGTGITTGGGFDGGKPKPLPGPPKPSYPGANAFEMNRFRQAAILQRDADKANEILLESNKRVVPVLTDMWATYNTEEVQAATRMAEEKAETLRLWEEENKKTSSRMLQLSERTAWAMQESFSDVFYDQMKGKLETFKDYFSTFLDTMQRAWADIMGQMMTQWIFGQDMKGGGMLSQAWSFVSGILGGLGGDGGGGGATSLSTARWSPRAAGGPVSMGSPYLVGEKGPELFVPNKSGNIIPDKQVSGGGNVYHLYNITANDAASFVELARRSGAVPLLAAENLADNGSLRKAIAESL